MQAPSMHDYVGAYYRKNKKIRLCIKTIHLTTQ